MDKQLGRKIYTKVVPAYSSKNATNFKQDTGIASSYVKDCWIDQGKSYFKVIWDNGDWQVRPVQISAVNTANSLETFVTAYVNENVCISHSVGTSTILNLNKIFYMVLNYTKP